MINEIHKFSDFADEDEIALDGEKVKLEDLLDKEIVILKFKVSKSKYEDNSPNCLTVQFNEVKNQEKRIFFSGSNVMLDLLKKYEKQLPFITTIKKIKRYYTLT